MPGNSVFTPLRYYRAMASQPFSLASEPDFAADSAQQAAEHPAPVRPGIVHFGTGRRFRAAVAPLVDRMIAAGHNEYAIIAVSRSDSVAGEALLASGGQYRLIEHQGGKTRERDIRSIVGLLGSERERAAIIGAIADPQTRLLTLTTDLNQLARMASEDAKADGQLSYHHLALLVEGLAARFEAGYDGLTVLMCDNEIGGNKRLASLVDQYAVARDVQLADWIAMNIRFPAAYCDRLVVDDGALLAEGADVAVESFCHWVVEDNLGPEREALEDVGVLLVPDVAPFITTRQRLLDGGLMLIACVGMIHGYSRLDEAYADPAIAALFDRYIEEAKAGLPQIKGLDLERYVEALRKRIANPAMRLPLALCAADGSVRLPRSALPTIVAGLRAGREPVAAAAMVAAWTILVTSPDLPDRQAEALWSCVAAAGDDWPDLVNTLTGHAPVFGTLGQNQRFRDLVIRAAAMVPGLESLVPDEAAI